MPWRKMEGTSSPSGNQRIPRFHDGNPHNQALNDAGGHCGGAACRELCMMM